jgi:hypothetical protein
MRIQRTTIVAAMLAVLAMPAAAAELPEGTVIGADNIDKIKNDTFQGHAIASLLTERMEWRIRNSGMRMPLAKTKEIAIDPKWAKASQANAGKTKINRDKCVVDGWGGGMPFPNIDEKDPEAAEKIVWNWHLGQLYGDVAEALDWTQLLVDGAKGIHAEPTAEFSRYNMKGRLDGKTEGDGSERGRQLLYFKSPSDMKGLGTFTVMYDSAKMNDVWAYIPAVRRIRRLSGGAWMDPSDPPISSRTTWRSSTRGHVGIRATSCLGSDGCLRLPTAPIARGLFGRRQARRSRKNMPFWKTRRRSGI